MQLAEMKGSLSNYLTGLAELIRNKLSTLDEQTLLVMLWGGLAFLVVCITLGLLGLVFSLFRRSGSSDAEQLELPTDVSVILRDMNSRISSLAVQAKDEQLYFKQELNEIKELLLSFGRVGLVERQLEDIATRIASYSNLMREEYHTMKEDLGNLKSQVAPAARLTRSSLSDALSGVAK